MAVCVETPNALTDNLSTDGPRPEVIPGIGKTLEPRTDLGQR